MADTTSANIVDSPGSVIALLDCLESLNNQVASPSLFCDLEGVKLSRRGSISIFQIFVPEKSCTYLVDVHVLGESAFVTSNGSGATLKSLLESASITKVFFDVRNDADALCAHYGIHLQGVHDLQLMEVASRRHSSKARISGLARCIEVDVGLDDEAKEIFKSTKHRGLVLFAPAYGGSYEVFNFRPLRQDIIDYCTQDVVYLPMLYNLYYQKLSMVWFQRVVEEGSKRVAIAESETYDRDADGKCWSPWASKKMVEAHARKKGKSKSQDTEKTIKGPATEATMTSMDKVLDPKGTADPLSESVSNPTESHCRVDDGIEGADTSSTLQHNLPVRTRLPDFSRQGSSSHGTSKDTLNGVSSTFMLASPSTPPRWTCTICCRSMQIDQKEAHLSGKPHQNRAKQVGSGKNDAPTAGSSIALSSSYMGQGFFVDLKGDEKVRASLEIKTRGSMLGPTPNKSDPKIHQGVHSWGPNGSALQPHSPVKGIAKNASKQPKAKEATKKSRSNKSKEAGKEKRNTYSNTAPPHQLGLPYPSDVRFIGFGSGGLPSQFRDDDLYDDLYGGGALDYGICDKDCGWCGHCMDGIDV